MRRSARALPLVFALLSWTQAYAADRAAAAAAAANDASACKNIQPFYWEIGDRKGRLAGASAGGDPPNAGTVMTVASASKWFYGAYVAEVRKGQLTEADIRALTMRSGYVSLRYATCVRLIPMRQKSETVEECLQTFGNDKYTAEDVGRYFYNGAHFQHHAAVDMALGKLNNQALHDEIARQIGSDIQFTYDSPQLAAGISINADNYAQFLRKLLRGDLLLGGLLGADAVCTNPKTCPTAVSTPIPEADSWHYSLAHWVEDDPKTGDGTFSSPGAFGFYPWIDASKTFYGIVARHEMSAKAAAKSVQCGTAIRRAWLGAQKG